MIHMQFKSPGGINIVYQPGYSEYLRKATLYSSMILDIHEKPYYRPMQQIPIWTPNRGNCFGDSGGPAVIRNHDTGKDELVGVISYFSDVLSNGVNRTCLWVQSEKVLKMENIYTLFSYINSSPGIKVFSRILIFIEVGSHQSCKMKIPEENIDVKGWWIRSITDLGHRVIENEENVLYSFPYLKALWSWDLKGWFSK